MFYPNMYDPDENAYEPDEQLMLSYQQYREYTEPVRSQQQIFLPPPPVVVRSSASYIPPARAIPVRSAQVKASPPRLSKAEANSPRMSKAEALTLVEKCKRWIIAGSLVAFGILAVMAAGHVTGATSNQATPASNVPSTSSSDDGGFFQQQGGNGFGNNNPSQPPMSGSRTS